jgi:phospholipase/carboxylesterase
LIVEPALASPDTPIVLTLHGRGDKAERFARLAERLRVPVRFVVADAPMPWGHRNGRRWFDMRAPDLSAQLTARVGDLVTLADQVATRWPDAPRPYLLGFSQGAMLALQAIATRSDRFAGAIALSGALLVSEGLPRGAPPRPVLLTGGSTDRVVPAQRARDAEAALEALGHTTELVIFEGGHSVTSEVIGHIRRVLGAWQGKGGGSPTTRRGRGR